MNGKPNYYDKVQCDCGETATLDTQFIPPKVEDGKLTVHYVCPQGHKFVRKYNLK
jgi:hypothetical protein